MKHRLLSFSLLTSVGLWAVAFAAPEPVNYRRDVRPLLAANCLRCHGADEHSRSANLRLDEPNRAVIPGDILASKLITRVSRPVGDALRMPPQETGHSLTEPQINTLRRWIGQGAKYEGHWAFSRPLAPARGGIDPLVIVRRPARRAWSGPGTRCWRRSPRARRP